MKLKAIDLLRICLVLLFGGIGVWLTVSLFHDATGWIVLAIGFAIGFIGTELHYVPMLREKWKRVGVPGHEKTEEQSKAAEAERRKSSRNFNLAIIVGGILFAFWRMYLPDSIENIALVALWGSIPASVLRILWLVYQEGAKLKMEQ
jgi:hypothetical protein